MANPSTIKALIDQAGLSQRGAARALEINERTMRRYCSEADKDQAPKVVELALMQLAGGDSNEPG
jgi:predicted DNA-binding protein (UPF0251 family)